jgi:enoyl-CoA hydratase/carnithine racemase
MALIKREVYAHLARSEDEAEAEALQLMLESFQRPDFVEGVASFVEKRPPRFTPLASRSSSGKGS